MPDAKMVMAAIVFLASKIIVFITLMFCYYINAFRVDLPNPSMNLFKWKVIKLIACILSL